MQLHHLWPSIKYCLGNASIISITCLTLVTPSHDGVLCCFFFPFCGVLPPFFLFLEPFLGCTEKMVVNPLDKSIASTKVVKVRSSPSPPSSSPSSLNFTLFFNNDAAISSFSPEGDTCTFSHTSKNADAMPPRSVRMIILRMGCNSKKSA